MIIEGLYITPSVRDNYSIVIYFAARVNRSKKVDKICGLRYTLQVTCIRKGNPIAQRQAKNRRTGVKHT